MPSIQFRQALITTYDADAPDYEESLFNYMNYQQEICPTTGREHWQVYVQCIKRLTLSTMKGHFGTTAHVQKVVIDNGASEYCLKDETSVDGTRREFGSKRSAGRPSEITFEQIQECDTWVDVLRIPNIHSRLNWAREVWNAKVPDITLPEHLREWQTEAIAKLLEQDDRKVDVYVDYVGGKGKTVLSKYLIHTHNAFLCTGGKTADIMYAYQNQSIVVFDLARAIDENYWPYQAMEFFKNGIGFSSKYESTTKIFAPCKVIIFANQDPDKAKLSADRWNITYLSQVANIPDPRAAAEPENNNILYSDD